VLYYNYKTVVRVNRGFCGQVLVIRSETDRAAQNQHCYRGVSLWNQIPWAPDDGYNQSWRTSSQQCRTKPCLIHVSTVCAIASSSKFRWKTEEFWGGGALLKTHKPRVVFLSCSDQSSLHLAHGMWRKKLRRTRSHVIRDQCRGQTKHMPTTMKSNGVQSASCVDESELLPNYTPAFSKDSVFLQRKVITDNIPNNRMSWIVSEQRRF